MTCPAVVDVITPGPPGIGLPSGVGFAEYAIVKDGNTPYLYKLVSLEQVGLPQALGITASPTFAGITLSGFASASVGIVTSGTSGQLARVSIGSGLSIVNGALVASGSAGTNLSYDPATRILASSTGDDVTLPLATTLAAGLQSAADKTKLDAITVDTATRTIERVRNTTGAEIPKGSVVRIPSPGSSGTTLLVALADASEESTAANTYGIAENAIPHNSDGIVVTSGELTGLNTDHLVEGGLVYLSEIAGQITSTRPTQPAHGVIIGWCIKKGPGTSGILAVKIANGQGLNELHDVLINNPTEDQFLRRSGNLWINETVDLYSTFTAPLGFTVTGSDTASISLAFSTGYSLPTTAKQGEWDTAYSERNRWDGGSTGLDQATGRSSLGLGSAATRDAGSTPGNVPILDSNALIPSILLPGFVDDVLEFANLAAFPTLGESGKLYISLATNRQYRWSGSVYVEINPSPGSTDSVPEGSINLYFTSARASAAAPVQSVAGKQGSVTLSVGDIANAVSTSDSRLTDSREWSAETIGQAEAEAGTATTRRAWTAERVRQAVLGWWNSITSSLGRSLVSAATQADARSVIGAGTSNLALGTAAPLGLAGTAAAGTASTASPIDHQHQRDTFVLTFILAGSSADPTGNSSSVIDDFTLPFPCVIIGASLGCPSSAVTTNPIIVNATLNGTSIFSTKPQINVGGTTTGNTPVLSITSGNTGDILRVFIDQASGGGRLLKFYLTLRRS